MRVSESDNILDIDYSSASCAAYDSESRTSHSYRQLGADVRRIRECLTSPQKCLVACFCRNDYQTLSGYLAALAAGHAVMLLDPGWTRRGSLLDLYCPEFVLASTGGAAPSLSGYDPVESHEPQIWRRRSRESNVLIHPDVTLLLTTSGSTGSPKFVRLSSRNIMANAISIVRGLDVSAHDRAITSLPFFYSYGLSVVHTHLLAGATLVLTAEALTSRDFWEVCRSHNCTSFAGVPYSYQVLQRLGLPGTQFPSLTTLTQAGGHLSNDLVETFWRLMSTRKGRFFVMYGQTEATARIAILPPEWLPDKLGSAGRVISGAEIETSAAAGSEGMVVYRGPNVMLGYAHSRQDLARGDEQRGELHTGDSGYLDQDGFLYITGRLNRFAKVSGVRINLDEVESRLNSYGPAAVVGKNEKLIIFCESTWRELFTRHRDALARDLSIHRQSLDVRSLPSLPLKSNGKVDYRALEEVCGRC